MIEKVIKKYQLSQFDQQKEDLKYWMSKTSEERVEAVEILRRIRHGDLPGLQELLKLFIGKALTTKTQRTLRNTKINLC